MEFYEISWEEFKEDLKGFSKYLHEIIAWYGKGALGPIYLYPIARGGWLLYWWLRYIDNSLVATIELEYAKIILDDICDTSVTLNQPQYKDTTKVVMYQRLTSNMPSVPYLHAFKQLTTEKYILLPFENKEQILQQATFRTGDKAL